MIPRPLLPILLVTLAGCGGLSQREQELFERPPRRPRRREGAQLELRGLPGAGVGEVRTEVRRNGELVGVMELTEVRFRD